ncbi:hypothetical protein [Kitasatospora sp. CB02891]|uniref:hypothetical protein n=1 Tax=Kitasatospora sp. CB02891 TaxID=2020329 RepID=UPI000CB00C65|nr:hypothetical protein [Kitasatospora sp. CB02891]PJN22091.1 hypothetical protein CG736_30235 [Kitasatospora sp. CB02891]
MVGRRLIGLVASWFTPPGGEREPVLAVREGHHPLTGRTALELAFPTGAVRCDGRSGDLRVRAVD